MPSIWSHTPGSSKQIITHLALNLELWLDRSQVCPLNTRTEGWGRLSEKGGSRRKSRRLLIWLMNPLPHWKQIWGGGSMWGRLLTKGLNKSNELKTSVSPICNYGPVHTHTHRYFLINGFNALCLSYACTNCTKWRFRKAPSRLKIFRNSSELCGHRAHFCFKTLFSKRPV